MPLYDRVVVEVEAFGRTGAFAFRGDLAPNRSLNKNYLVGGRGQVVSELYNQASDLDLGSILPDADLDRRAGFFLDAGGGSGAVTTQLAALCKRVYSYDINKNHLNTIAENCKRLDLDHVIIKPENLITAQPPEKVDLIVLDMPDPSKALTFAKRALKQSGFIVAYTPHITQAQRFAESLDQDFKLVTTIELMQRRWEVTDGKLRPKHDMLGHTAFLTVARLFSWS